MDKLLGMGEQAIAMSDCVYRDKTEDESLQDPLRRQEMAKHDNATSMMIAKRKVSNRVLPY